jgi:Ca-activated chloride channel family protein
VLQPLETQNDALPAQWARARLRDMEDRYAVWADASLEKEIVQTSLRFGVLCRFTAFVAVDRAEVVNKGGPLRHQVQAVDAPAGWDLLKDRSTLTGAGFGGAPAELARAIRQNGPMPAMRPAPMAKAAAPAPASAASSGIGARHRGEVATRAGGPAGAPPPPAFAPALAAPAPAAAKPAPAKKSRGFFGSREEAPAQAEAPAPLDLAPYRARAKELAAQVVRGGDAQARLAALGTLIVRLSMLVDDLQSVGAPNSELAPLRALLEELTTARDRAGREQAAPAPFEDTAEKALRAFATGSGTTPPSTEGARKRGFWK